ncbi:MAG TPA: sensor histidine kinase [Acidimicrobiia bacterium]
MDSTPSPSGSERGWARLRSLEWSRALDAIVHGGMVVGMVSYSAIELITSAGGRFSFWLVLPVVAVMVWVVLATFRNPLSGVVVASGLSISLTVSYFALRAVLGLDFHTLGLAEVAAISILASEVVRTELPSRASNGVTIAVVSTGFIALRSPAPLPIVLLYWLTLTLAVVAGLSRRWSQRSREMSEDAARREERLAIARELHDTVAHHVTGIVVQAQAARAVGDKDPEAVQQALAKIEESGVATMNAMRRLVGALRESSGDEPLAPTSGLVDLETLAREAAKRDGYVLDLDIDRAAIPPSVEPSIFRIVQESLTNVGRHGVDVSRVEVKVRRQDDGVQVSVVDDGEHHERPGDRGFGLTGMSERVSALGGQFWAGQRPGRGWSVTAWIPVER